MDLEIHYDPQGEWAALYVDGNLLSITVGDNYHAEEKAFEICGVKQIQDSPFLCGGDRYEDAAPTLAAIAVYKTQRDAKLAKAAELEAEAERLRAEAKELRS